MNTHPTPLLITLILFFTANAQFPIKSQFPIKLARPSITTLTIECIDTFTVQRGENTGKFLIFIVPKGHHVAVKKIYTCFPGKVFKLKFKYELEGIKLKGLSTLCHSKFKLHAYGCYSLLDVKSETVKYVGQNFNNGGGSQVLFGVKNGLGGQVSGGQLGFNKFGSTVKFPSTKQQFKAFSYKYSWKIAEKVLVKKLGSFGAPIGGISKKLASPIIVTAQISKFSFGQKNLIDQIWGFGYAEKPGLCDGKGGFNGQKTSSLCDLYPVKYSPNKIGGPVLFDKQPGFKQPGFKQPGFKQPGFKQPGFKQPGLTTGFKPVIDPIVSIQPVIDPIVSVKPVIDPLNIEAPVAVITDQIGPNTFIESATDDTFTEEIISPGISVPQADFIEGVVLP